MRKRPAWQKEVTRRFGSLICAIDHSNREIRVDPEMPENTRKLLLAILVRNNSDYTLSDWTNGPISKQ